MRQYIDLLQHVLDNGVKKDDRTGVGTLSIFGYQMRFDLQEGFPLLTTKKLSTKSIVHELLWFLKGDTNVKYLRDHGVTIWDEWADGEGNLGPVYGHQWRKWRGATGVYDQISSVIEQIKKNPNSRRLIVSAWNVGDLEKMALAPCHCLFQFYVQPPRKAPEAPRGIRTGEYLNPSRGKLCCQLYQRSADVFLGVPFNIASYSLLTHMIAQVCELDVGDFVHSFGDTHLYLNHIEQAKLQLTREPRRLPRLKLNQKRKSIFDFIYEDIEIEGYDAYPRINAPIAV